MAVNDPSVPNAVVTTPVVGGGSTTGSAPVTPIAPEVPSGDPAAVAFNAANHSVETARDEVTDYVVQVTGSKRSGVSRSPTSIVQALGGLLKLAVVRPIYGTLPGASAAAAVVDRIETGEALATTLEAVLASVKDTNHDSLKVGYAAIRAAHSYATHNDPNDQVVQSLMAPAAALFAKRPRAEVAATKAGTATLKKAKAQARTTKASTEASTAQQKLQDTVQTILGSASTTAPATGNGSGNGTHTP